MNVSKQLEQVTKDTGGEFKGSEELLSLVRSSVAEASLVNETNEQVSFKLIITYKLGITIISLVLILIGCDNIFPIRLKSCCLPPLPKSSQICWRPWSPRRCS